MRFGLCFGDFEHAAEKLPLAKTRLGYDYVEVALCKLADMTDAQLKEFGAACEAAGLKTEATNIFFSGSAPLTGPNVDVKGLLAYTDRALYKAAVSYTHLDVYKRQLNFLHDMKALNLQNRTVGLIENGSWAPAAGKQTMNLLSELRDVRILEPVVTIKSSLKDEGLAVLMQLKDSILASLSQNG